MDDHSRQLCLISDMEENFEELHLSERRKRRASARTSEMYDSVISYGHQVPYESDVLRDESANSLRYKSLHLNASRPENVHLETGRTASLVHSVLAESSPVRQIASLHLNYISKSVAYDPDSLPLCGATSFITDGTQQCFVTGNKYSSLPDESYYLRRKESKYDDVNDLIYDFHSGQNFCNTAKADHLTFEESSSFMSGSSGKPQVNIHDDMYLRLQSEPEDLADQSIQSDYLKYICSGIPNKEIVEALGPEEVRWLYKTDADKKWIPFIGYDSLRIEWAYREMLQKTSSFRDDSLYSKQPVTETSRCEKPVVCGGLYEVDVSLMKGCSIYWKADEFTIMRGMWFYEGSWMPLEDQLSERIELEHLTQFQGHHINELGGKETNREGKLRRILEAKRIPHSAECVDDVVIHSLTISEGHVDWFSAYEIFFSHDATPSRLMRSVSKKLGFQKTGYKIHRGYCLDASSADKPPDISHIVFVIHGIGQKMETGRIIKNCTVLRDNVKLLKEKYFPDSDFINQRVEFFPVEWRSSLTLDAGLIDSITPQKIIGLRQMLNDSFMDIMYYNSPQYREEIVNGLTEELDRLYTMFTARNPYFEANGGKVSVIAHSLGCVITYDIVTGWSPAPQMSQSFLQALIDLTKTKSCQDDDRALYTFQSALQHVLQQQIEKTTQPRVKFKIENFFCLGSPLSVFLGLRWKRQDSSCWPPFNLQSSFVRLYNIFHPADPVAYRFEPLICPKFSCIAPVTIHSYTASDKPPYDDMPLEPLNPGTRNPGKENEISKNETPCEQNGLDVGLAATSSFPMTPNKGMTWNIWNLMKVGKKGPDSTLQNNPVNEVADVLKHRIDFVLREGSMESSYLSALTSHTSYWGNLDVAYFLLCTLCPKYVDAQKVSSKSS